MSQRRYLTQTSLVTRRAALVGLLLCLLPLFVLAESAPFRFAWLSDTHVGAGTGDQDLLAAVRDIKSLTGLSFDFSVNSRYPKVRTLWTYETGYSIASGLEEHGDCRRRFGRGLCPLTQSGQSAVDVHHRQRRVFDARLVDKDGVVFYGTKNDLLIALDAKTGALKWEHKLGTGVMNTVVPLSSTQVLTTDFDGKVALIEGTR